MRTGVCVCVLMGRACLEILRKCVESSKMYQTTIKRACKQIADAFIHRCYVHATERLDDFVHAPVMFLKCSHALQSLRRNAKKFEATIACAICLRTHHRLEPKPCQVLPGVLPLMYMI